MANKGDAILPSELNNQNCLIAGSYFSKMDENKLIQGPEPAEWNTACDDDDE